MPTGVPDCGNDHEFYADKIGDVKRKSGQIDAAITADALVPKEWMLED